MQKTKRHGTHSGYSHGCRCEECLLAHRVYERNAARRRRRVGYGIEAPSEKKMDATPVREHVIFLASKGIGLGAIASSVGVPRSTIQNIKRGTYKNTTSEIGNKILAVPAIPRMPMAYTDATPIKEMIKKLETKGISRREIGRMVGCRYGQLKIKNNMRVWRYNQLHQICSELLRRNP